MSYICIQKNNFVVECFALILSRYVLRLVDIYLAVTDSVNVARLTRNLDIVVQGWKRPSDAVVTLLHEATPSPHKATPPSDRTRHSSAGLDEAH